MERQENFHRMFKFKHYKTLCFVCTADDDNFVVDRPSSGTNNGLMFREMKRCFICLFKRIKKKQISVCYLWKASKYDVSNASLADSISKVCSGRTAILSSRG